jgi:uncharacterized protein
VDNSAEEVSAEVEAACEPRRRKKGMSMLCPDRMVESVTQITHDELRTQGVTGVILDLDNTLVLWRKEEMTSEISDWLNDLLQGGFQLCLLSNSPIGDRSKRIAARLGCHYVHDARKPRRKGFRKAMEIMGTTPESTAIIGDQMFTDVLGGNRSGVYTIMVKPMHKREFPYTRFISRPPERLLLRMFRRQGHI